MFLYNPGCLNKHNAIRYSKNLHYCNNTLIMHSSGFLLNYYDYFKKYFSTVAFTLLTIYMYNFLQYSGVKMLKVTIFVVI